MLLYDALRGCPKYTKVIDLSTDETFECANAMTIIGVWDLDELKNVKVVDFEETEDTVTFTISEEGNEGRVWWFK